MPDYSQELLTISARLVAIAADISKPVPTPTPDPVPVPPPPPPTGNPWDGMRLVSEIKGIPPGYKYQGQSNQDGGVVQWREANIALVNGVAEFSVKKETNGVFTCAMIENINMRQTGDYCVEVEVEAPDNPSSWWGFWLYDDTNAAELDVIEVASRYGLTYNTHAGGSAPQLGPVLYRANDGKKHTYAVRVTQAEISFWFDGVKQPKTETRTNVINYIRRSGLFPKWQNKQGGSWAGGQTSESRWPHVVKFHATRFYKP